MFAEFDRVPDNDFLCQLILYVPVDLVEYSCMNPMKIFSGVFPFAYSRLGHTVNTFQVTNLQGY